MDRKEKNRIWRQNNKEKLQEDKNRRIECECGVTYTNKNRARHFRSKNHNPYWFKKPKRERKPKYLIKTEIPKIFNFDISF